MAQSVDPIARFRRWFDEARKRGNKLPEAAVVATADRSCRPSARFVLLKRVDQRGFVFYSDAASRKGRELAENPVAALLCYWDETRKQVRIEGRVERVSTAEADAYWQSRPRQSRLAVLASRQSGRLSRRADLLRRMQRLRRELSGKAVPRPRRWTGFLLRPQRIEFWIHRAHRLHHRELFLHVAGRWRRSLLQP